MQKILIVEDDKKISLKFNDKKEAEVYTHSKWTTFIVNQLLQNAIKYYKNDN